MFSYKIKGRWLNIQFHIVVIISFLFVYCIYTVNSIIESITGLEITPDEPSFGIIAIDAAVALRKTFPNDVTIYINVPKVVSKTLM